MVVVSVAGFVTVAVSVVGTTGATVLMFGMAPRMLAVVVATAAGG